MCDVEQESEGALYTRLVQLYKRSGMYTLAHIQGIQAAQHRNRSSKSLAARVYSTAGNEKAARVI